MNSLGLTDITSVLKSHISSCSAAGHQLVVPSYRLNSCGLRAFSVLGPTLWNSLPHFFGHSLKTFFSNESTFGALAIMRYTNLDFTYLLRIGIR